MLRLWAKKYGTMLNFQDVSRQMMIPWNIYLVNIGISWDILWYLLRWKISWSFLSYMLEYPQKFTFWGCFPYCFWGFLPINRIVQRSTDWPSNPALPTDQSRQATNSVFFVSYRFLLFPEWWFSTCRKKKIPQVSAVSGKQHHFQIITIRSASLRLASIVGTWIST